MDNANKSLAGHPLAARTTPLFDGKAIPAEPNYTSRPQGGPVPTKTEPTR
jgi:hypothetical protein